MGLQQGIYGQRYAGGGTTTLVPGDGTTAWTGVVGMTATLGKIVPTTTGFGWDTKGGSFGTVPASTDFTLSFNPFYKVGETEGSFMSGISNTNANAHFNTIKHCFNFFNGFGVTNRLRIFESGTEKVSFGNNSYLVTDLLEIKLEGTTIKYYKNGSLVYTSLTSFTGVAVYDGASYQNFGAENIQIVY